MARRRYQKGSIRKRGTRNPIWELQWWEDYIDAEGKIARRRESRILGDAREITLRQARKLAEDFLRPLNQGRLLPQSTLTLRAFVDGYFVPHVFPTLKVSTQQRYQQIFKLHLLPAFGETRLCDINPIQIQSFLLAKMQQGLSWESVAHFRNLFSKVFAVAKKWGYFAADNPVSGVELPEKQPVREKHALEPEHIRALLAELTGPVRIMVELGIFTGMRVGEILGLRWKDVDLLASQVCVEQALYRGTMGTPKTKGSRRTLPLPTRLRDALAGLYAQAKEREGDALVFPTAKGTPQSDTNLLHRHLKPAGTKLGTPWLNWHTLRRTHATLYQAAGGSLRDAQAQLGHSRMSTTLELYTIPLERSRREAVEKLSDLVTNGDEWNQIREGELPSTQQIQ